MKHWESGVVNQRQRGEEGRPPFKSISENVTGVVEKGVGSLGFLSSSLALSNYRM